MLPVVAMTSAPPPATSAIAAQECKACHTYAPAVVGLSERDFPFDGASSKHRYRDCIGCHDVVGWRTGEAKPGGKPLHASTGGDGTGWQQCSDCHVFGADNMAQARPQVDVKRWAERTFRFPAQTHPDITTIGKQRSEADGRPTLPECVDCHRAEVPQLDSRLIERRFRHATHLPPEATAESCTSCHPRASTAGIEPGTRRRRQSHLHAVDLCLVSLGRRRDREGR